MASTYPQFDSFSLQDDTYIVSEIVYRSIPERILDSQPVVRRPGVKLLSTDFASRKVNMSGYIISDSVDDLRTAIDNFHTNITRKTSGTLYIESDRSATAIVSQVTVTDPHYAQTVVPFQLEFTLPDPFYYSAQQSLTWTVPSGTSSMTETITISGSAFAEPLIQYTAPGTSGLTTTSGVVVTYGPTAEYITWSGTLGQTTASYGDIILFDYPNHHITQNSTEVDIDGVFARWEPGQTNFTITFSGTSQGGVLAFSYSPRYL